MNKNALPAFIPLTAVIVLSLLYFFFPAYLTDFYPACIFHSLTGLDCPICGTQRAASALVHGQLVAAAGYNLLFIILLPFILYAAVTLAWNAVRNNKSRRNFLYTSGFIKTMAVLVLLFWIFRNIPVSPFTWLKA